MIAARRRLPWGLLGMLALVAGIERFVARHDLDFTTLGAENMKFTAVASRGGAGYDVLCFGDSLVKYGIVPRAIEAGTGGRAFNLASAGATPPASYFMLRRAIMAGARPSVILVDFKPNLLAADPRGDLRAYASFADLSESFHLARAAMDGDFFAAMTMARLLPSIRARREVRAGLIRALRGEVGTTREMIPLHRRNWAANRGAQINPRSLGVADVAEYWDEKICLDPGWACHPINRLYVDEFFDLAAQHAIPVVWLLPPINPRVQSKRDQLGLDLIFDRFVREVQTSHPGVRVVDGHHSGYPVAVFTDSAHLDSHGAHIYSEAIASLLSELPSPAAGSPAQPWTMLPQFRDKPIAIPFEDLSQSATALRAAARTLRR